MDRSGLCFLIIVVCCLTNTNASILVTGTGATLPAPLYAEWIFAYNLIKPNIDIEYTVASSSAGQTAMNSSDPSFDFGASDAPLSRALISDQFPVKMFPVVATSVVPLYNIPSIGTNPLYLSRSALVKIFLGQITDWQDDEILATNQHISHLLPNDTISIIIRKEGSGTTSIFSTSLASIAQSEGITWPYNNTGFQQWPSDYDSKPNFIKTSGNSGVTSYVINTVNSIGYIAFSALAKGENYVGVGMAWIPNKMGNWIDPTNNTYVENSQSIAVFNSNFNADITDPSSVNGWPLCGFTYLMFTDNINKECDKRSELFKWFNWILTNSDAISRATSLGYSPLELKTRDKVMKLLQSIRCGDSLLLEMDFIQQHTEKVYPTVLGICASIVFILAIVMIRFHRPSMWNTFYTVSISFGCFLCIFASVFWFLVPTTNSICVLRQWITGLGCIVLLATVVGSRWHLSYIKMQDEGKLAKKSVWIILFAIALQILIQVLWTGIDGFKLKTQVIDPVDLTQEYICSSDHITAWICLCIAEIVLILFWGVYLVFDLHKLGTRARHEVRWLLINVYNISLILVVLVPVFAVQKGDLDWAVMLLVLIFATSNVVSVLAPLAIRRRKRSIRKKMLLAYVQSGGEGPLTDVKLRNFVKNRGNNTNLNITVVEENNKKSIEMSNSGSVPNTPAPQRNIDKSTHLDR